MLGLADKEGDGQVNYNSFYQMITGFDITNNVFNNDNNIMENKNKEMKSINKVEFMKQGTCNRSVLQHFKMML